MTTEPIDRRRDEFPTLNTGIYLLSHSLGPVPTTARASMSAYLDQWESHSSEDAWGEHWWMLSNEVGDRIARLIGAASGSVQVQPNASVALSSVVSCFDWNGTNRSKVVTTALDFPSMGYIWQAQQRAGAKVVVVPSDDGISVPTERILDAIDESTALVALSYVSYRSSARVDAKAIVQRAHQMGAKVLLDIYQAVGVVELEVADWRVDFAIGGSIKWLCGGPACGYLYVRPDLIEALEPRLTGWIAHENPFEFSHEAMRYDKTVRRFAQGTPSIPGLFSILPGLKIIEEVGLPVIATESRRRTQRIVDAARTRGWPLHSPIEVNQRGGSVMIFVENPEEHVRRLASQGVFVDCRPGVGLRISPHFFNTDEEIEQTLDIIAALMK